MSIYLIRRELGNAGRDDVDAAAIRALSCAYNYEGLRWLRSYWDEPGQRIFCLYEAASEQQLVDHAAQSRIPCDEIIPVVEVLPDEYSEEIVARANA